MTNDESGCSAQTTYIYPGFNGTYHCRQTYLSMVNLLDGIIGNVTAQFQQRGLWNNTLVVFSSDSTYHFLNVMSTAYGFKRYFCVTVTL